MNDPERVQHRYDVNNTQCLRCGASAEAIREGFVNVLCAGKPIAHATVAKRIHSGSVTVIEPHLGAALEDARTVFRAVAESPKFTEEQRLRAFEAFVRAIVQEEARA